MADWETAPDDGWETAAPSRALIERQAGELGRKASGAAAQEAIGLAKRRDPDVSYIGMPDMPAQAQYSLISKPEDRTEFLRRRYGAERVGKDSFGRDVILSKGKKIAFVPEEGENIGAQWSSLAGEVLPTAGIIAGGVVGAPLGPVGGMTFAAGGGAAGEAANQLLSRGLGLPNTQSSEEAAKDIVTKGIVPGGLGEGVARGAGFIGRSIMAPYQPGSIFGPWAKNVPRFEEQMADVEAARGYGLKPHVGTASPNARLVMRAQAMAHRIFGDELPQMNRPILQSEVDGLTQRARQGVKPSSLDMDEAVNEVVASRASALAKEMEERATNAANAATSQLRATQEAISKKVGQPSGGLATAVETDIRANRDAFGNTAKELYAPVDQFAGGPKVPTAQIKQALKSIIEDMPPTKSGEVSVLVPENLKAFAKGINDLPDYVTFQQMQAIRHKFYSKAEVSALNAGLSDRQAMQLASAADRSFDEAGKAFSQTKVSKIVDANGNQITQTVHVPESPEAKAVTEALRKADEFYKAGVKKFDDLALQSLVKDATQTGRIEPEKVASFIAKPGYADKLLRIKSVVSPETFAEVGKETWAGVLRDSTDAMTGQINGKTLASKLNALSKNNTLDILFGAEAPRMRTFANQLAAFNGQVSADTLAQGVTKDSIKNALAARDAAESFTKANWFQMVQKDGPQSLNAAEWLTRPDNRLALRNAIDAFGKDSPIAVSLREYLARRIFVTMEQPATRGAEKYAATELMGEPLVKELNRYGRPYLEDVFGKEWTNSAFNFAKAADTATKKNPADSGGIIASMLGIHPLHYVGTLARLFVGGEMLSTNPVITYLSRGFARGETAEFLKDMAMLGTRSISAQVAVDQKRNADELSAQARAKIANESRKLSAPIRKAIGEDSGD